jgi:hypothetical protein
MQWSSYHANPRISYYLFMRRVYGMFADEALRYVKRVGTPPTLQDIRGALNIQR